MSDTGLHSEKLWGAELYKICLLAGIFCLTL